MKILGLILLSLCIPICLIAQDQSVEMLKIKQMDAPTASINGKSLKVGDTFPENANIVWGNQANSIECVGLSSGIPYRFTKRQFESKGEKGAVQRFKRFFLRNNMASTRGTNDHLVFTKSPKRDQFPEHRLALVIGNSNYLHLTYLRNPLGDAESIAQLLLNLGFDVIEGYDCCYEEMKSAFDRLASMDGAYDAALVYYAGHGIQEENHNYLIPIDIDLDARSSLQRCILADDVVEKLDVTACNTRILILDACRNVKTYWRRGANATGLVTMEGSEGMAIVLSTKNGQTALDGDGSHSPFAQALLDNLNTSDPYSVMIDKVVRETYALTGNQQCPVPSGSLISDFRFNPSGKISAPAPTVTNSAPSSPKPTSSRSAHQDERYASGMKYYNANDYSSAFSYLKPLAEEGYTKAYRVVAEMYHRGRGVDKDRKEAEKWYTKAAKAGDEQAKRILYEKF